MQASIIGDQNKKRRILPSVIWLSVIALTLLFSSDAAEYIRGGISLCTGTVIPSVFPFMVISSMIMSLGAGRDLGAAFSFPIKLIFGVSDAAACPILLGFVCGYPTGAYTAATMLDRGEITKKELSRLLTFINVPGAAFVICAVGEGMLSSKRLGIFIYLSVMLAAVTVGIAGRLFRKEKSGKVSLPPSDKRPPFSKAFPEAVRTAAVNMMTVCACVITFSALSGMICSMPFISSLPSEAKAIITGFFEVSSGAKGASAAGGLYAPLLASAVCAWSGLSVHMQIISACRGRGISFVPFFISKAVQAALAPAYLLIFLHFFG